MTSNHDTNPSGANPFEELVRLQSTFQQNLSEATMNYLRQLQGLVGPVTPGTVVQHVEQTGTDLVVKPGAQVRTDFVVENRQRVHSMITPMLSPMVCDDGTTWFPEARIEPSTALLATNESQSFEVVVNAPKAIQAGVFRGSILIYGCADGVVPLSITIATGSKTKAGTRKKAAKRKKKTTSVKAKKKTSKKSKSGVKKKTPARSSRKKSSKRS